MNGPRLGCVSYLNSKPLIDPMLPGAQVHFDVPANLLQALVSCRVDAALLSVADFQLSQQDLIMVPAGGICCDGPTLTVRIFSKVPPPRITRLYGDAESHTSVILGQLILRERYRANPVLWSYRAESGGPEPESLLLIGDKVVNAAPRDYPYTLDLGEEWKRLTGKGFIFAAWMMRRNQPDRRLALELAQARAAGVARAPAIAQRHAQEHGWPVDLAQRYMTEFLRYEITAELQAGLNQFFEMADAHGLLPQRRTAQWMKLEP